MCRHFADQGLGSQGRPGRGLSSRQEPLELDISGSGMILSYPQTLLVVVDKSPTVGEGCCPSLLL